MIKNQENKIAFAERFLLEYVARGFGIMSKRETELLVFHLISDLAGLDAKSNHELSIQLKISPTKVKNYRFERRLRYSQLTESEIKKAFIDGLKKSTIKINNSSKWIILSIEDLFVREAIKAKLKDLNHFSDGSFNSELISLDIEAFSDLLSYFYSDTSLTKKQQDELKKHVKDISKDKSGNVTVKGLLKALIEGTSKDVVKGSINAGLSFLTGGVTDIASIIMKVKEYFAE